ncbi:TPA: N4-gp56 family major capsid protein [Streptococcus pneumoniae]|nr:N4-gp56 family major capsid protein [Streptococcus pneumoniae]HEV6650020.1 N4-gp56 family major capsid protein [Streptococcus pneumoniae]HEW4864558.1 N4-gp56 family major capsid protein [Streptococcus pneumoniae]HEX1866681.1 N4-gp56 family major capsid protein [Streptococcus pneumoniae]
MAQGTTTTVQVINPQVMADMVSAKLPKLIKFTPLAYIERTLVGIPGDTLTVAKWTYSGDATEITEGQSIPVDQLGTSKTTMTIKQAGKAVEITDKAALVAHGDIYSEAARQIALAIANKVDNDLVVAAKTATQNIAEAPITVDSIDKALQIFEDEEDAKYVALVNPKDAIKLRADAGKNWLRGSELGADVIVSGTFGEISGVQVVRTKKVEEGKGFLVKISPDTTDEEDNAKYGAFVINLKRDVMVENDRDILKKTTVYSGDEYYGTYLYDDTKVVKFGGA